MVARQPGEIQLGMSHRPSCSGTTWNGCHDIGRRELWNGQRGTQTDQAGSNVQSRVGATTSVSSVNVVVCSSAVESVGSF